MVHDEILFHNTMELVPDQSRGFLLQRVPESVRVRLEESGQRVARRTANTELRFLADGPVRIWLSAPEGPIVLSEYRGDFLAPTTHFVAREATEISIDPHAGRLPKAAHHDSLTAAFHPSVIRLAAGGGDARSPLVFHGATGHRSPPEPSQLPEKTLLVYGTSITHGHNATAAQLTWPALVARSLGWDLRNLGMAGSCFCEPAMIDFLCSMPAWDLAVFEASVNMHNRSYVEFEDRIRYLFESATAIRPQRPIVATTILPYYRDFGIEVPADVGTAGDPDRYRRIVRETVRSLDTDAVHLLEGSDLLPWAGDLGVDLIHPGDHGMIRIAAGIGRRLHELGIVPETDGATSQVRSRRSDGMSRE